MSQIKETVNNIIGARDIVFTQIVNLAMKGELKHLESAFDQGDSYSFTLSHFENVKDENVKELVELCKEMEKTVFKLIDMNGLSAEELDI